MVIIIIILYIIIVDNERWKRCVSYNIEHFGYAYSYLFINKVFTNGSKDDVCNK